MVAGQYVMNEGKFQIDSPATPYRRLRSAGEWLGMFAIITLGFLLKIAIDEQFKFSWFTGSVFTFQTCAIALVAWLYRTRQALVALLVTIVVIDYLYFEPKFALGASYPQDFNALIRFGVVGLVLIALQHRAKRSESGRVAILQKLLAATHHASAIELRLDTALNALTDPLAIYKAVRDRDGNIVDFENVYLNRAASAWNTHQDPQSKTTLGGLLSEALENVVGVNLPDDYRDVVASGTPVFREVPIQIGPNRSPSYIDVRIHKLEDGVVVQWRDITALKQAESALRESEGRLLLINESLEMRVRERTREVEARSEQLRALALDLAETESRERKRLAQILHDHFQQLVSAAKLKVGIMRRKATDSTLVDSMHQVEELLAEAINASRSLATELSPPVLHDAGLGPALEWLARRMERDHNLAIFTEIAPECEPDNDQVRTILFECARELLFNVAKHAGVDKATIKLCSPHDGLIHVIVSDTGVGFDPNLIESTGKPDGSFGLFSIRERLGLIGGLARIRSAPGEGATIELTVPTAVQPTSHNGSPRPAPQSTPTIPTEQVPPIRVMVADDHKLFREGLISLLTQEPFVEIVGHANDGAEALDMARRLKPDVLFMDVSMPRLNGVQVTQALSRELPDIRIIGLSMHEREDMANAMRNAGASAYLTKGGSPDALISVLRSAATGKI